MKLIYIIPLMAALLCAPLAHGARKAKAKAPKVTPEELFNQARSSFLSYDFETALEKLEEYEEAARKAKKPLDDD